MESAEYLYSSIKEKIILISNDNSFKDYCENSKKFLLFDRIDNLISSLTLELDNEKEKGSIFISTLKNNHDKLIESITEKFENTGFTLDDEDGVVNEIIIESVEIEEINIIEINSNQGLFIVRAVIDYYANVKYIDQDNSIYDKEDDLYYFTETVEDNIGAIEVIDIEVKIKFDVHGKQILKFTLGKIKDISVSVNRDEIYF